MKIIMVPLEEFFSFLIWVLDLYLVVTSEDSSENQNSTKECHIKKWILNVMFHHKKNQLSVKKKSSNHNIALCVRTPI